jgi:hypothetical protein
MERNKDAQKPDYDLYITGGKRAGRILACKKPFYRGNGVFRQSMNDEDWVIVGDKTLTGDELHYYMEKIRESNVEALIETIRHYTGDGYNLNEDPPGTYTLVKEKKT